MNVWRKCCLFCIAGRNAKATERLILHILAKIVGKSYCRYVILIEKSEDMT